MASVAHARIAILGCLTLLGVGMFQAIPVSGALGQAAHTDQPASSTRCDVPSRSFEDVTRLIQIGRSEATTRDSRVVGASAKPVALEGVQAVLMQFVACSGAGEPLRVWSLYTDAYLARLLARERGYDRVRYDLDAEPHPSAPPEWPQLTGPDRAWVDGSGRMVADASIRYPNLDRTKYLRFWFAWQDGQLRIDEVDGEITFAVP